MDLSGRTCAFCWSVVEGAGSLQGNDAFREVLFGAVGEELEEGLVELADGWVLCSTCLQLGEHLHVVWKELSSLRRRAMERWSCRRNSSMGTASRLASNGSGSDRSVVPLQASPTEEAYASSSPVISRGIDESGRNELSSSVPGAASEAQVSRPSISCSARGLKSSAELVELSRELIHGEVGTFSCCTCSVTCHSQKALDAHFKRYHKESAKKGSESCQICGKRFQTNQLLRSHIFHVHREASANFKCSQCESQFKYERALRKHMHKVHSVDERKGLSCSMCDKVFYDSWKGSSFALHMRDVHGVVTPELTTWKCSNCGKSFPYKSRLLVHERLHNGEKPHVCKICNQAFRMKQKLRIHFKRMHSSCVSHTGADSKSKQKSMEETETPGLDERLMDGVKQGPAVIIPATSEDSEEETVWVGKVQDLPYLETEDDIVVLRIQDENGGEGETIIIQADVQLSP